MGGWLRDEVLRYAGMGSADPADIDPRIIEFADWAVEELYRQCRPRFTSKIFSLETIPEIENGLRFGGVLDVTSRSLSINLKDCGEAVFFAATLGVEADRLIKQYSSRDMSQGVLMDAAAAAIIETYCDSCQVNLEKELNREYKTLRPRFSPGYGDFDIKHQRDFMRLMDLPRAIGVTVTEGGMLSPTKSVTAVMGVSRFRKYPNQEIERCTLHGCEACMKKDCIYRRNV